MWDFPDKSQNVTNLSQILELFFKNKHFFMNLAFNSRALNHNMIRLFYDEDWLVSDNFCIQ